MMQARITEKSERDVIAAIQALNLESVKMRVMDPKLGEGWSREYADSIEAAYKNYLTMLVKNQDDAEDILLSEDVDEFWHTHILQTTKYARDCESVFGRFLHHEPHVGEVTAEDREKRAAMAEKTRRLYQKEFGSMQDAETAWAGAAIKPDNAAMSAVFVGGSMKAENAAMSAVFIGKNIRPESAAMSAVFIGKEITAENAAMSAVFMGKGIRAENAAMSAVFIGKEIKAENAAMSAVFMGKEIRPENAAMSAVFVGSTRSNPSGVAVGAV
jgi:hypothetical protein